MTGHDISAILSPNDPEKEAEVVAEYLWHFDCDFCKTLSTLIKDAEWPDLLKIRDTWSELWVKALKKGYAEDTSLEWCNKAAIYYEKVIANREKMMKEFRESYDN